MKSQAVVFHLGLHVCLHDTLISVLCLTHLGDSTVASDGNDRAAVPGPGEETPGHRSVQHHLPEGSVPR